MKQVLIVATILALCATPSAQAFTSAVKLQTGDVISIVVTGQEGLAQEQAIWRDGQVSVNFLGKLPAVGLTVDELALSISRKLHNYLLDPKVTVRLVSKAEPQCPRGPGEATQVVRVAGAVKRAGTYCLHLGDTAADMVAKAGGFAEDADLQNVVLTRAGVGAINVNLSNYFKRGDATANPSLMPNDNLFIPFTTPQRVYVLGQVKKPGPFPFQMRMTARQALDLAGGVGQDADLLKAYIHRGTPPYAFIIAPKICGHSNSILEVELQAGDALIIPRQAKHFQRPLLQDVWPERMPLQDVWPKVWFR